MTILRRLVFLAVVVGLMVAGWSFATSNEQPVSVDYLAGRFSEVALWVALAVSFGLGALLVGLFTAYELSKSGLVARRYRKAIRGLEDEVHQLRNLPLTADQAGAADETRAYSEAEPQAGRGS